MFQMNFTSFFRAAWDAFGRRFEKRRLDRTGVAPHQGISLDHLLEHLPQIKKIQRADLRFADRVVVQTQNSQYDLLVVGDGEYLISGGWFDRERLSPYRVRINGCTWGGSIIWKDVVAAPGMCIEFNNRVITSPVRRVVVYRPDANPTRISPPSS